MNLNVFYLNVDIDNSLKFFYRVHQVKILISDQGITHYWSGQTCDILLLSWEAICCRSITPLERHEQPLQTWLGCERHSRIVLSPLACHHLSSGKASCVSSSFHGRSLVLMSMSVILMVRRSSVSNRPLNSLATSG